MSLIWDASAWGRPSDQGRSRGDIAVAELVPRLRVEPAVQPDAPDGLVPGAPSVISASESGMMPLLELFWPNWARYRPPSLAMLPT